MNDRHLILAPHIDDELIGCWTLIANHGKDVDVLYLYELTPERMLEAIAASKTFGFNILKEVPDDSELKTKWRNVYVPSRRDWHADHRETNRRYRKYATLFYSVDMSEGKYLGVVDAKRKQSALEFHYPSQASLFRSNDKYGMFEDISHIDYTTIKVISYPGGTKVELDERDYAAFKQDEFLQHLIRDFDSTVRTYSSQNMEASHLRFFKDIIDRLFSVCKFNPVLSSPHHIIK